MAEFVYYGIVPITFLSCYFIRQYFRGAQCRSKNRLDGKIVIVTGANCGIGYETALDLVKRGAHVILACRDKNRAQDAFDKIKLEYSQAKLEIELLDCASLKSVKEFAERFLQKHDRLDILINNAGLTSEKLKKTEDGFEITFQVNYLSQFYLTNLLMESLQKSAPSRIVNVSALAGKWCQINWDDINLEKNYGQLAAYKQSKLAQMIFTYELARRYKNITSVSLHPGGVDTDIFRNLKKNPLIAILFVLIAPIHWLCLKTSRDGAQTTIYCAVDNDVVNHNGCYFNECKVDTLPTEVNEKNAQKLWQLSENLLKLN